MSNELNKSNELELVNKEVLNVPSYLPPVDVSHMEEMNKVSKPPMIKVVQALTGEPFKPKFKDGDIVISPQMVNIGDMERPFSFTPIYFHVSYVCLNPIGVQPALREISFDDNSLLAKKCKTFAKEKCPENPTKDLKFSQTLNFIVLLDNPEFQGTPVVMFLSRGEFRSGQNLIGLIQQRKSFYYAMRFRAVAARHSAKGFTWFGLDFMNDSNPWVDEQTFKTNQELHNHMAALVQSRQIVYDVDSLSAESDEDASQETRY